ncbi:MAG TPA: hypothetical protein DDW36_01470 [Candidatus Magasanikbacteria bacterium]|nr:hypothetical protein [Candidatus Magasanikbacteria bacterium]
MQCRQCKNQFEHRPEDLLFYKKMDLPPATLCKYCRRQHLLCWRQQRYVYGRTCDVTGKQIVSTFPPKSDYKVVDRDYWWSDVWNPLDYGRDFDFSQPFFPQFDKLMHEVPMACIFNSKEVNSAYCTYGGEMKNCYLVHASWAVEDSMYGSMVISSKDCVDCLQVQKCEGCYECIGCSGCYNTHYSLYSERCIDSLFLASCYDCINCVGCVNLRKKNHCILNKQYTKEEYEKKVLALKLDTREGMEAFAKEFGILRLKEPHKFANLINCEDTTGDHVRDLKRCAFSFNGGDNAQDCAYVSNFLGPMTDVQNGYGVGDGFERGYMIYDTGVKGSDLYFCGTVWGCAYAYYCFNCHSSFELFGCSGVRNKKYCILNKEYPKEDYLELKKKIIAHMKETGEWGEYFPPSIAPFGYNTTLSYEYVPLTKEQALAQGFKWEDALPDTRGKENAQSAELGNTIQDVHDDITQKIFACADCGKNYKIIKQELAFYKKMNIPAPHKCPDCRYVIRLKKRNPHDLWHRQCMCVRPGHGHHVDGVQCRSEFETVYAPERKETIYCEECYRAEFV